MTKEQIDSLSVILKILDKAQFQVSGPELIDIANKLRLYAKTIKDLENELNKAE